MITASLSARHTSSWKSDLAQAISDPADLLRALDLDPALLDSARRGDRTFRTRVPWSFVRRMQRGSARDPLLLQVLPSEVELLEVTGFVADPLGEKSANPVPGLLHKYTGRALLITTAACAIHCRYCFRREFPYDEQGSEAGQGGRWSAALDAIARDSTIEEVILSGGDPLSLSDARLAELTRELARIPHVRRLRLHTRTAVVLPSRVDDGFMSWLTSVPWPTTIVVHTNHANEIDEEVRATFLRLRGAGVTLLNQSVLLAGVNDSVESLAKLSTELFDAGVLPYYLHLLDRVRGVSHFEVSEERALALVATLASRLPGYLVPRLARETAGAPAKIVLAPRLTET